MRVGPTVLTLLLVPTLAFAQQANPLVGAWERTSLKGARGASVQPPAPSAFLIFTPDGFFTQVGVPLGRPKQSKPLAQMTREELLARFDLVEARRGTWTVSGDRVTRVDVSSVDPNTEGLTDVRQFRIEGNTLILTSPDPNNKVEARFQRLKGSTSSPSSSGK